MSAGRDIEILDLALDQPRDVQQSVCKTEISERVAYLRNEPPTFSKERRHEGYDSIEK